MGSLRRRLLLSLLLAADKEAVLLFIAFWLLSHYEGLN